MKWIEEVREKTKQWARTRDVTQEWSVKSKLSNKWTGNISKVLCVCILFYFVGGGGVAEMIRRGFEKFKEGDPGQPLGWCWKLRWWQRMRWNGDCYFVQSSSRERGHAENVCWCTGEKVTKHWVVIKEGLREFSGNINIDTSKVIVGNFNGSEINGRITNFNVKTYRDHIYYSHKHASGSMNMGNVRLK